MKVATDKWILYVERYNSKAANTESLPLTIITGDVNTGRFVCMIKNEKDEEA